ncbi:MbcA/ParS/Xre antitoxin family protein [Gemmatimonas sp.]|uniref:MbcA/ParS/Xre antitoxin family protein n=1 Tax=Gemmatimonas sp. TaxID=1962908 RepID=UPI0025BF1AF7|nr:MbcA/ParS/Xre antitoxin family protein [Gemmatimonas sp.]MCA2992094.1 DUF2384 domain-containing protein [Gemmatimonas sp.]
MSDFDGDVDESHEERVRRVHDRAVAALGDAEKAKRWMAKRNRALGGLTPDSMLSTAEGAQTVVAILVRIEHGVGG